MKVHNPENRSNIIPKAFSIFPAFAGLMLLHGDGLVFNIFSAIFLILAVYTFFFTTYERYLDTDRKCTVKRVKWLFIKTNTEEPIRNYDAVVVSFGDTLPDSNIQAMTLKVTFNVVLVRKYASTVTHSGFGSIENFLLQDMYEDINEACRFAKMMGEQLGLPVKVDEEVLKRMDYDPLSP